MEQPIFYNVEKDQASFPSKKNDKYGASITPTKTDIDTVDK